MQLTDDEVRDLFDSVSEGIDIMNGEHVAPEASEEEIRERTERFQQLLEKLGKELRDRHVDPIAEPLPL